MYCIQHCSSAAPQILKDAGIEPRTVALRLWHWQSDALTTRLDLIQKD
jgi:hypothetical protein